MIRSIPYGWPFLLFFLLGTLACVYYADSPPGDYANYYFGSRFLLEGKTAEVIYDPVSFNTLIRESGISNAYVNYAPVPPFSLLFYIPFAFGELYLSKFIFNLLSIGLFSLSLYRLFRVHPLQPWLIIGLLFAIAIPVKNNLVQGQSYLLLMSFLIEGYLFSRQDKKSIAAALFALPVVLKLFPGIILLWLWFSGKRREFGLTLLWCAIGFLVVIPFTSSTFLIQYLTATVPRLFSGDIIDPYAVNFQSFTVLLRKLLVRDALLNPNSLLDLPLLFYILNTLFVALVITFTVQGIRSREASFSGLGLAFLCSLLISGYGTNYSLVLLLPAAAAYLYQTSGKNKQLLQLALLFLICSYPVHLIQAHWPLLLQYMRLYALVFFFILQIRSAPFRITWSSFALVFSIMAVPAFLQWQSPGEESQPYLDQEPSLMIDGFRQDPEGIMIYFLGKEGPDSLLHKTADRIETSSDILIRNNQLFYRDRQLTFGKDQKKEARLLNGNEVLYLSDKGRGVSLYGLRKVKIKCP